ncbi:hypothetical protein PV327_008972 [Microctonus hyperodae]|uniref:Uncharacterized protein n=1 Tax=Microctonus hyperodae TaxID=165561 RepID=A0AA39FT38_MICHY|nr:hypothetical protein PV327_008972 [Microctonus hyperodae]
MFMICNKGDTGTFLWRNKKLGKSQVVMPTIINMGTMEMIACLWIILAFSSEALSQTNFYTHGRYGKRGESHTPDVSPFFSGSRYGRNEETALLTNNKLLNKNSESLPRVDRFFLGSRYGKRGLMSDQSVGNKEHGSRSIINLRNLEAALNYIYHARYENKGRLIIGNGGNYRQKIINNKNDRYENKKIDKEKIKSSEVI